MLPSPHQRYLHAAIINHTTFTMPWMTARVAEVQRLLGADWWPYSLAANRKVLDTRARLADHVGQPISSAVAQKARRAVR